jgi:hypothetical protein
MAERMTAMRARALRDVGGADLWLATPAIVDAYITQADELAAARIDLRNHRDDAIRAQDEISRLKTEARRLDQHRDSWRFRAESAEAELERRPPKREGRD